MFWNVENFFDWRNDSTTVSDVEFSAKGERHWTWKRFQAKANAFAKALFWVEAETGHLPDIVGLEEVENAFVLRQVLQKTALRKLDYKYVHFDSPDRRGIDVALLYRTSRLELLDSKPCHLFAADTVMATRDILLCVFKRAGTPILSDPSTSVMPDPISSVMPDPDRASISPFQEIPGQAGNDGKGRAGNSGAFAVLVNHHPSKYGGASESEPRRRIAVERLRFLADSLAAIGIDRIIAGGDFNDTPDNPVFRLLEPVLLPLHKDLSAAASAPSSTMANGTSSTISMFPLLCSRCRCPRRPWTLRREKSIDRRTRLGLHRPAPGCGSCGFPSFSRATPSIPARNPSAPTPAPATPAASPTTCPSCWR